MPGRYAVLIPTKGRVESLTKLFTACPALNRSSTFIGQDVTDGDPGYTGLFESSLANKVRVIPIANPGGYTSVAREYLRQEAVKGRYDQYVLADDNCKFDSSSLANLIAAREAWGACVMAGVHPTATYFHAKEIADTAEARDGLTSYFKVGMIYWCIPHSLYKTFQYPNDCYFDDVYLIIWAINRGFTNFRCCLDAPFEKHLHEPGGTGDVATRIRKRGIGFIRLATDFPQWMTTRILTTHVPYKKMIEAVHDGEKGFQRGEESND